jgi:4'-phosphopantetheinyl transferase
LIVDEHGRPALVGPPHVSFNVSHSGSLGLIAVADGRRRLGVDIEQIRFDVDVASLAAAYLHPTEARAIGDHRDAFFRCWTLKEAVVKALGRGLPYGLDTWRVDPNISGPQMVDGVKGMCVTGLAVDAGYAAALAFDGRPDVTWAT